MIVSPDIGGVVRARAVAKSLGVDLAIIDKRRAEGQRLRGDAHHRRRRRPHLRAGRRHGRHRRHPVPCRQRTEEARRLQGLRLLPPTRCCPGRAIENLENSVLDALVVTNTIPLSAAAQACSRIRQLDMAPVIAEAVRRISNEESISAMFR